MNVQTVAYPNTAMAAQYVASQNDVSKAAIGAKENADLYGLKILAENIERKCFKYDAFYCDWIRTTDTRESF